jgi:hypothetical protein
MVDCGSVESTGFFLSFYLDAESIGVEGVGMAKQRGYPDRHGMGAQSDFIAEQFVPSEQYKAEQMARVQHLLSTGLSPEQVAKMFSIPFDLLSGQKHNP